MCRALYQDLSFISTQHLGCDVNSIHSILWKRNQDSGWALYPTPVWHLPNIPSSCVMDPGFRPTSVEPTSRFWRFLQLTGRPPWAWPVLTTQLLPWHHSAPDGLESTLPPSTESFSHKLGGSVVLAPLHPWEEAIELITWAESPWMVSAEITITASGCQPQPELLPPIFPQRNSSTQLITNMIWIIFSTALRWSS